MRSDSFLFAIGVLAIVVMGSLIALVILYPQGLHAAQTAKHISISASGIAYASPQTAMLYAMINGSGYTPAVATLNLSNTLSVFNSTILGYIGNNSSDITTQSYSLRKVYNKTAYEATEYVVVDIPNINNVSNILGLLSKVNDVYVGKVTSQLSGSQTSSMIKSALSLAVQNATAQAQAIAGNQSLSVLNVSIYSSPIYPYSAFASAIPSGNGQLYFNGRQGVSETVSMEFSYR